MFGKYISGLVVCSVVSLVGVVSLTGCATVANEGSNIQTVRINSSPEGAYCFLNRKKKRLGGVLTPGEFDVKRDQHSVQVLCSKRGYQDGEGYLVAELDPWVFGNVLTAGLGAVVDIGTGAASEYEPTITVTLIPDVFGSQEEKAEFHAMMQGRIDAKAEELLAHIKRECGREDRCEEQIEQLNEEKWKATKKLRQRMNKTVVIEEQA